MLKERLRYLRNLHGFTQKQVAEALNIERSTYTYYETGKTHPDLNAIVKIAKIYSVTLDYLLVGDNAKSRISSPDPEYHTAAFDLPCDTDFMNLNSQERSLIMLFRLLDNDQKDSLLEKAKTMSTETPEASSGFVSEKKSTEYK